MPFHLYCSTNINRNTFFSDVIYNCLNCYYNFDGRFFISFVFPQFISFILSNSERMYQHSVVYDSLRVTVFVWILEDDVKLRNNKCKAN